jgi:hypothetical protein
MKNIETYRITLKTFKNHMNYFCKRTTFLSYPFIFLTNIIRRYDDFSNEKISNKKISNKKISKIGKPQKSQTKISQNAKNLEIL